MRRLNPLAISLAALASGVTAVALGVVVLVSGEDDSPATTPAPAESSTASPETATAGPTAQPEYRAIRVIGDLPWPSDLTMLTTSSGYAHGSGTPSRTRLIVGTPAGPSVIELSPPGDPDGTLMGILADPGGGPLYAAVCSGQQCIYEGAIPDLASKFFRSTDGGFRWTELSHRDGRWWPRLAVDGDFVIVNFDGSAASAVYAISNRALSRPEAYSGLVLYRGAPAWISRDLPMLVREDGSSLLKFDDLPTAAKVLDFESDDSSGRVLLLWTYDARYFVTTVDGSGATTFESKFTIGRISRPWADGKWLVEAEVALRPNTCAEDYAKDGDHGLSPAVFDPATGDLAFFGAPYFASGCAEGAETVIETWTGTAAKVITPGDCLNVRGGPGAVKVVDCLPNGAIVLRNGPITESGGIRWVWITTLGGNPGWVAEPFLAPP